LDLHSSSIKNDHRIAYKVKIKRITKSEYFLRTSIQQNGTYQNLSLHIIIYFKGNLLVNNVSVFKQSDGKLLVAVGIHAQPTSLLRHTQAILLQ
jgi:hypothetical protein